MRVGSFTFDTLLYEGADTRVWSGTDAGGAPVIARWVGPGHRDLTHEHLVLAKVAGPGVVASLGVFEAGGGQLLIQPRFGAGSLAGVVQAGRLELRRALEIGLALARVCARIHDARIIHRDLRPGTVLYDPATGAIAIGDFALAAELPVDARALPAGDRVGTPGYMSPEHAGRTAQGCDVRSDLYSVGVTLYELITGELPFGDRERPELAAEPPPRLAEPPHGRVPSIPPVVGEIAMKLLADLPDERYQSARGLAGDLERCLAALQGGAAEIAGFELGQSDLRRVRFVPRLFGRAGELATLTAAYAQAATGVPALVVVSGRAGAGRGELVRALIRDVAIGSPLAFGGWRGPHDRPLAGLGDALGSLAEHLVRLDPELLAGLREQFTARVGQVGQAVIELVPALGDVFGAQPALPPLAPGPARARLQFSLRCLAAALGDPAPFVLALRGFEHADPGTVNLLEALLDTPTSCRLLIVLIAQDPAGFGRLGDRNPPAIELGGLPAAAIRDWVAATLACDPERAAELGDVLHARSGGNPLAFMRLLDHLVETGAIERRAGRHAWSIEQIRAAAPPPTLGTLAAQRIAELDGETRRALAAVACGDEPLDAAAIAAMVARDAAATAPRIAALARAGLVVAAGGCYRVAHPVIAQTAVAAATRELAAMHGRLGAHLLAGAGPRPSRDLALRIASALGRGNAALSRDDRVRAAELHLVAAEHLLASVAYEAAAALFSGALAQLGDRSHRDLQFRGVLGHARALTMLGRHAEADAQFQVIAAHELSAREIGLVYPSWCDNHAMQLDRPRTIALGLEGLARLGLQLPAEPSRLRAAAAIRLTQRVLDRMTLADHLHRPDATDERAVAAVKILASVTTPAVYAGRMTLYVLLGETALGLVLRHGHMRNTNSLMALHACFLHALRGDFAASRRVYEVAEALEAVRPAPELVARTAVVLDWLAGPWFRPWQDSAVKLGRAIVLGVEAGDPVFAALCASASVAMLLMTGTPLDRVVAAVEGWGPFLRGDGGAAANAANVLNLVRKMSRGEPIVTADLERVSRVALAAGPMRNNAKVNLGLALAVCGHETQVRAWLDELRDHFAHTNFAQPYRTTLWLLDGLFAAKDVRNGRPDRRDAAERMVQALRDVRAGTGTSNHDPAIALIEAQLARADGELDRAAGLFGRAARDARGHGLTHLVAYAHEERAHMVAAAGWGDEAALYYREAVAAYRQWQHLTKVAELEHAHPEIRALALAHDDAWRARPAAETVDGPPDPARGESLGLVTALDISHEISAQLTGSGIVRAVLTGIARHAGAERLVFVMRTPSGERVVGEVEHGSYRDVDVALDACPALPRSVVRAARRTGRPLVVADAVSDPAYATDPFVAASRSRSIAVVPARHNGEVVGFVVLENRRVAGAFTPQLVSLSQALVTQAAISLENASLYRDLEDRVTERTLALHARNSEIQMVLDHVAQGLVMVGADGRLLDERSAVLATWFPDGMPATLVGLFAGDPGAASSADLAWRQLIEGAVPVERGIRQLPAQLRRPDRVLQIDWQPILNAGGGVERMLVVLSDVTCALRQADAAREQKQLMAVFETLSDDPSGAAAFLKTTAAAVGELTARGGPPEVEHRLLHALTGQVALFGLSALAARCAELEDAMAHGARPLTDGERGQLAAAWQVLHGKLQRFLEIGEGMIQIRKAELDAVIGALRREGHPVASDLELWTLESMAARFQRIAEQARGLAERVGKGALRVQIEHNGVYLDRDTWAPFWAAFVHVLRNAIDHGFEDAAERARLGKGTATLALRSYQRGATLVIELSDDGRGIAWDRVADRARGAGLPAGTRDELIAALFADGVTTRSEAGELSGRGVGLGAIAEVCRAMDGEIAVDSTPGHGTTMRFAFRGALVRVRRDRPPTREPFAPPAGEPVSPAVD